MSFFPNSNSFGVFSHSESFWGRIAFGLSMVLWGRSVLGCQKVPRKVPPRFLTKVPPRFHQGSAKVPPRFQQGSTKLLQVSWCLWFSAPNLSWAAKRFRLGLPKVLWKLHLAFTKVPPRFHAAEWGLVEFHLKINRCGWGYSLGLFLSDLSSIR